MTPRKVHPLAKLFALVAFSQGIGCTPTQLDHLRCDGIYVTEEIPWEGVYYRNAIRFYADSRTQHVSMMLPVRQLVRRFRRGMDSPFTELGVYSLKGDSILIETKIDYVNGIAHAITPNGREPIYLRHQNQRTWKGKIVAGPIRFEIYSEIRDTTVFETYRFVRF